MSYRDDLAALEGRVEDLRREATAKVDDLERFEQLVEEARRLVRARVLEGELATPCIVSWDDMQGDGRVRHCRRCRKNVYNFAELTRSEIDALIVKHEGSLCARLFLRADGTVLTKDCTRDIRIRPSRLAVALGAAAIAAAAAVGAGGAVVQSHATAAVAGWNPPVDTDSPIEVSGGFFLDEE